MLTLSVIYLTLIIVDLMRSKIKPANMWNLR